LLSLSLLSLFLTIPFDPAFSRSPLKKPLLLVSSPEFLNHGPFCILLGGHRSDGVVIFEKFSFLSPR